MAPQFTAMNGASLRGDSRCSARATSSLPVPDSPPTSTVVLNSAILRMVRPSSVMRALRATMSPRPVSICCPPSWLRRFLFSRNSRSRSSALRSSSTSSSDSNGFDR